RRVPGRRLGPGFPVAPGGAAWAARSRRLRRRLQDRAVGVVHGTRRPQRAGGDLAGARARPRPLLQERAQRRLVHAARLLQAARGDGAGADPDPIHPAGHERLRQPVIPQSLALDEQRVRVVRPGADRLARQREPALLDDHGSTAAAGDGDLLAQAHLLREGGRPCGCRFYGSFPNAASWSGPVRPWCSARSPPAICRWTTPTAYRTRSSTTPGRMPRWSPAP